jgi:dihydrofolate reductase
MKIIVAMTPNGIIGVDGGMPWHYPADLKRFKRLTMGGTLIMGHLTWRSIGKHLAGRRIIVLSRSQPDADVEIYASLGTALLAAGSDQHGLSTGTWVCGGGEVYKAVLTQACGDVEAVDVTIVPEVFPHMDSHVVHFPTNLLEERFQLECEERDKDDPCLLHRTYLPKH